MHHDRDSGLAEIPIKISYALRHDLVKGKSSGY